VKSIFTNIPNHPKMDIETDVTYKTLLPGQRKWYREYKVLQIVEIAITIIYRTRFVQPCVIVALLLIIIIGYIAMKHSDSDIVCDTTTMMPATTPISTTITATITATTISTTTTTTTTKPKGSQTLTLKHFFF
jgi:hypothetical protein